MQIIWSDGSKELIFLTPAEHSCLFFGNFENNLEATATIKGCRFEEETLVTIDDDGLSLEIALKNQVRLNREKREDYDDDDMDDGNCRSIIQKKYQIPIP